MSVVKQDHQKWNVNEKSAPTEKRGERFADHIIHERAFLDVHRQKWFDVLRWHLLEKVSQKKISDQPIDQKSADDQNRIDM